MVGTKTLKSIRIQSSSRFFKWLKQKKHKNTPDYKIPPRLSNGWNKKKETKLKYTQIQSSSQFSNDQNKKNLNNTQI